MPSTIASPWTFFFLFGTHFQLRCTWYVLIVIIDCGRGSKTAEGRERVEQRTKMKDALQPCLQHRTDRSDPHHILPDLDRAGEDRSLIYIPVLYSRHPVDHFLSEWDLCDYSSYAHVFWVGSIRYSSCTAKSRKRKNTGSG